MAPLRLFIHPRFFGLLPLALCLLLAPGADRGLRAEGGNSEEALAERIAEAALKKNKEYIFALDAYMTNRAGNEERDLYRRILLRHLKSKAVFLAFRYTDSVTEIERVQRLLIHAYRRAIDEVIQWGHQILLAQGRDILLKANTRGAPVPETSGDANTTRDRRGRPRYSPGTRYSMPSQKRLAEYLKLGLRDIAKARQKKEVAENLKRHLLSNKLHYYLESLKFAAHALEYSVLISLEIESLYPIKIDTGDFTVVEQELKSGFPNSWQKYLTRHYMAFFKSLKRPSAREQLWTDKGLNLAELKKPAPQYEAIEDPPILVRP